MEAALILPKEHQGIQLQCPGCKRELEDLLCSSCGFHMEVKDGVVHALLPDREAYYSQFIADYERIRAAEGRVSRDKDFYLALPYKDTSGCNAGQWRIRAKSYDYLIRHIFKSVAKGGTVLDLGAGNCWMSFRLTLGSYRSVAVDLLTNQGDGLGAAAHFDKHLPTSIPRFQAELSRLPFHDEQFDVAVFSASFHYSEDYSTTLREALRCLKQGGLVVISDTPWYSREESGQKMVTERRVSFQERYGTKSDSVKSLEFLTDERLQTLERQLSIRWEVHRPWYGWQWSMRPLLAKLRGRREPSQFRIYVARKDGRSF
jgi:SAM-dependent methyltransferase